MKQPLVILAGPTATGKSELSVRLAKRIKGSVISADSMQIYRYLDIGSAKIKKEEMQLIPHYLVDELLPEEEFNIVIFQKRAKQAIKEIYAAGRIPIITGGTGFYIQSVLYDIDFSKEPSHGALRQELEAFARENGNLALHQRLSEIDKDSACAIHPNNLKRVIRALEFYFQNGYPISSHNETERQKRSPYQFAYFVLTDDRSRLYEQIEKRVDCMMEQGLLKEAAMLKERGCHRGMVSMQGLGYKEMLAYLEGEISLEEAVYILKRDTRRFAKRQLTWFRREEDAIWLDKSCYSGTKEEILEELLEKIRLNLKEKGIVHE